MIFFTGSDDGPPELLELAPASWLPRNPSIFRRASNCAGESHDRASRDRASHHRQHKTQTALQWRSLRRRGVSLSNKPTNLAGGNHAFRISRRELPRVLNWGTHKNSTTTGYSHTTCISQQPLFSSTTGRPFHSSTRHPFTQTDRIMYTRKRTTDMGGEQKKKRHNTRRWKGLAP